jgi:hypothetical protein
MANAFLEAKLIARQALPILQNNLVFPALVSRDYSDTYQKQGDTIQVERPAVYTAASFSSTISAQDINTQAMLVKLDQLADVSVEVTAKQLALNVDDFNRLVLKPAVVAIAEKINADGLNLYKKVPKWAGTSGTTPDGLDDFANAAKILNDNKVPTAMRKGVWGTAATAKFQVLDALVNADKAGTTEALREGSLGKVFGIENYMSQAVKTHTAGGYTSLADVTAAVTAASNAVDATTGYTYSSAVLTSAAGAATTKLEAGDILTIGGVQVCVLEQTAAAVAGVVTAKVYPAFAANVSSGAVIFADVSARAHVANLAFVPEAFTFVTRPLEMAAGAQSYTVNFNGLSIRVVIQYDISTKKTIMSLDTLYGWAAPYPELATRILG